MVGPRIGKVGSPLPEHIGENFLDEDEVDKLIPSLWTMCLKESWWTRVRFPAPPPKSEFPT